MTDPFRIRDHVADFAGQFAGYQQASAAARASLPCLLDVSYGESEAEKMDIFLPATPAGALPIHLFVHGGYWRSFSRKDYSFIADSVTALGAVAAIIDYALMPAVRMETLVAQVRRAASWLAENANVFGGDAARMSASGHSAGAHLACYLGARAPHEQNVPLPRVKNLLLVSGIYDLEPITKSFLQQEIMLTGQEVTGRSPISANWTDVAATVVVGQHETAPFHMQAKQLANDRVITVAGEEHMSIVRSLGTQGSTMSALLAKTIAASLSQIPD